MLEENSVQSADWESKVSSHVATVLMTGSRGVLKFGWAFRCSQTWAGHSFVHSHGFSGHAKVQACPGSGSSRLRLGHVDTPVRSVLGIWRHAHFQYVKGG